MNFSMSNKKNTITTRFEYHGKKMTASRIIDSSLVLYRIKISKSDTIEMFTKVCNVISEMSDVEFKKG